MLHGVKEVRGSNSVPLSPLFEGRFGRMFRRLPPMPDVADDVLIQLALQMVEPAAPGGWGGVPHDFDNPAIPSGYTYFGQFLDHDVTFDPQSKLDKDNDPDALRDFRTPRYDLDSVYGSGPDDEPFQYEKANPARLLIGQNRNGEPDLPRNSDGLALIGDPRNDENIIVSQLQLVFLRLHNKFVEQVAASGCPPERVFEEAQRLTRWHYQWVVVHDYLPRIVGEELVDELFKEGDPKDQFKLRYYLARNRPYMPIEFSAAAFRFGHSMIRGVYNLNATVTDRPIFLPGEVGEFDDLRGRRPLPPNWTIDWSMFFEINGSVPQPSRKIDSKLVPALADLPSGDLPLAARNLLRGKRMCLPSGQAVANFLKAPPVERVYSGAELGDVIDPTPLWFYILKESEIDKRIDGQRLGDVGGRIVAEVLLGLLNGDTQSYINQEPTWQPTVPAASGDPAGLTVGDLIKFATT